MVALRVKLIIAIVLIAILVSVIYTTNETVLGSNSLTGFYDGREILLTITEVSENREDVLGRMLRPSVAVNSSLKQMSSLPLGEMFVFVNGTIGGGPFGFQHSVLSSVPSEGNSSLMVIRKVSWRRATNEGSEIEMKVVPKELRSADDIAKAIGTAEITITDTCVVVRVSVVRGAGK